ncbi:MAG TPA: S41 family peptidase [Verrucomicrobiae bacterium]|nr:S41 family peptidase [Verrucomicrobiae bacterium]
MKRPGLNSIWLGLLVFGGFQSVARSETNDWPHFQEVFRLLRANLDGASEEDLNRAAVQGLLTHFYPRVILVTNEPSGEAATTVEGISQQTVYEQSYGYLRVARVENGLAGQLASAWKSLTATNQLKGLILDLRFADGMDYAGAAGAADLFLTKERPLLTWGESSAHSTAKKDAITLPLAVLVNPQTSGAAEALAEVLRKTDTAMLIGARTAGGAHVFKEFDLSNGRKLRIAAGSVRVGEDDDLLTAGIKPDIEVPVSVEDERAYFADAYRILANRATPRAGQASASSLSGTNRPARRRINEAELVRMQREGQDLDDLVTPAGRAGEEEVSPIVRDPALARAIDLLKGIAIVERSRRP